MEQRSQMEDPGEIELAHQRQTLRERRTHLAMDVAVHLFAMVYLVAILVLEPLMLAPPGFLAAFFLWRRR